LLTRGALAAVILTLLAADALGAKQARDPVGDWAGLRTMKLRAKGVNQKDSISFALRFGRAEDWRFSDPDDFVASGSWFRTGKSRLTLDLDAGTLDRLQSRILGTVEASDVIVSKVTAKTKLGAATIKLTVKVKFLVVADGRTRRGKWTLRASGNKDPNPDPEPGPVLVEQAQFRVVGSLMRSSRSSHTSTTLPDGRVLLAGGFASGAIMNASSEYFEPGDETFVFGPPLSLARANHTGTVLKSGDVLLVGGDRPATSRSHNSAEVYDFGTGAFRTVPSMLFERTFHSATRLPDGSVLVAGGLTADAEGTIFHRSAEIFDPGTDTWSQTGDMAMLRAGHQGILLETGEVLITGGSGNRVAEIYDPVTGLFRTVEERMNEVRSLHGVVELPSGDIFITDGGAKRGEFFDPENETFVATDNQGNVYRSAAVTFQFKPGEILIYGGIDFADSFIHGTMEQFIHAYAPGGRYFHIVALPNQGVYLEDPRAFSAVSELLDGRFLVTGGLGEAFDEPDLKTAVLFDPETE
jgi:hypothetical protein